MYGSSIHRNMQALRFKYIPYGRGKLEELIEFYKSEVKDLKEEKGLK